MQQRNLYEDPAATIFCPRDSEARTTARLFFDFNRARMNLVGACSMPLLLILRDSSEVPGRQTVAARNRPQQSAS
jgi:hypothetical protein